MGTMIRLNVVVVGASVAMTISFRSLDQRPRCRGPACSTRVRAGRGECIFYAYCTQFRTFMASAVQSRSEEHTSELQSRENLVCRLLLEKKKKKTKHMNMTCDAR